MEKIAEAGGMRSLEIVEINYGARCENKTLSWVSKLILSRW
jgi:hypothetical protein